MSVGFYDHVQMGCLLREESFTCGCRNTTWKFSNLWLTQALITNICTRLFIRANTILISQASQEISKNLRPVIIASTAMDLVLPGRYTTNYFSRKYFYTIWDFKVWIPRTGTWGGGQGGGGARYWNTSALRIYFDTTLMERQECSAVGFAHSVI